MTEKTEQLIWTLIRKLAGGFFRWRFAYSYQTADCGTDPCIVLVNHNTDYDPLLVGLAFPKHLTFVASEHVFRKGIASRILNGLFHPISRMKGSTDASAGMSILRAVRNGRSVCMFAEGNRSFNGMTGPVFPATGKLCRISGAHLVTFKIEGGYLTSPRWARTLRRGKMKGYIVGRYSPEILKSMSPQEVNERINQDLYENAFARQEADRVLFRGKKLAEGIERAFYMCPKCGKIGTIHSDGNRLFCGCGMSATYTDYGFIEGDVFPFQTVLEWDRWQTGRMGELAASQEVWIKDTDAELLRISEMHGSERIDQGPMKMNWEKMCIGETEFLISDISAMEIVGPSRIVFSIEGQNYEIGSSRNASFCGRKYLEFYKQLRKEQ